jgi:hypothetical protein
MAAVRIVSGVQREIWRESVSLPGGSTRVITTNIRCHTSLLSRIYALLIVTSTVASPVISATTVTTNGFIEVDITNSGGIGDTATYVLDIMLVQSPQQANDLTAPGIVHVIGAGGSGSFANRALSNLFPTSINASLNPGVPGTLDLGATAFAWRDLYFSGTSLTPGTNRWQITGVATATQVLTLPNVTGVLLSTANITNGANTTAVVTGVGSAATLKIDVSGFTQGSIPFGSATGSLTQDNADLFWDNTNKRLGIDVAATPTARLHLAAVTTVAGTASLKIPSGTVLTIPESGAVEADASHLYWTDGAGTRLQLDNPAVWHTPFYATATALGLLTLVNGYDDYMVGGSEDLLGISTAGRVAGDRIWLTFTAARTLIHGSSVSIGFAPLMLYHLPGESGYQDITLENIDGRAAFQLRPDSKWQIIAGSWS